MFRTTTCLLALLLAARAAAADDGASITADEDAKPVRRTRDASVGRIFKGPFPSSRLYTMPTADVVGAYVMSVSAESSLLQDTGVLTSAGVLAIGFGDIAQLEYRHTSAISITGINAPVPTAGVQVKLPLPDSLPPLGIAFRLGVPRTETFGDTDVVETVTDVYAVTRLRARGFALHAGLRLSQAKIELTRAMELARERRLALPTGGFEVAMNPTAKLVGEVSLAPRFAWMPGSIKEPEIGYGMLGRLGMRWRILPSIVLDGSIGYQLDVATNAPVQGPGAIVQWDIRLGAEVFVPWGALACRAAGVFCD
ncbi:MAG: hypothetical protein KF773_33695 [Deltaproteobacteria bacterium]|nr:hypothetical protein [Deltaproteobacteria bacterium]MCW5805497.1 hypothetical protein [Deltaproteobacteria bacterium]